MSTKLYAMLRVKNEASWIAECIRSLLFYNINDIIVLDDASDDGTRAICHAFGVVVCPTPFFGMDEARDKNYLYGNLLNTYNPSPDSWVIMIDGDEALECGKESYQRLWREIANPRTDAYSLKIEYLWDFPYIVRTDGWLNDFWRGSLWRIGAAMQGFRQTPYGAGANLHCSNIPGGFGVVGRLPIRVKHYGYMHQADRSRKLNWANTEDPDNLARYEFLNERHNISTVNWNGLEPLT